MCVCALLGAALLAAPARAGTIVFSSARCSDEADRQSRGAMYFPPNPQPRRAALWLVGDDGSGLRRITEGGTSPLGGDSHPRWSPDGQRIAYASEGAVWIVGADGSSPRKVTEGRTPPGRRTV